MKDPKYVVKQRKYRQPKLNNPEGWNGQVSLKDMPIYPPTDERYMAWSCTTYMELGDGYWLEIQKGMNLPRYYTIHHRHDNGKSVGRNLESQCATCKDYLPEWVKGSLNLIKWSMEDEKALNDED